MKVPKEQLLAAYQALPPVLRAYVTDPEFNEVIDKMGEKHGLHIDVIGALAEVVTYMLLGFIPPEQLVAELQTIGIATNDAAAVLQDLNQEIFVPLNKQMREEGGDDPRIAAAVPAPAPTSIPIPLASKMGTPATASAPMPAPPVSAPARSVDAAVPSPVSVPTASPAPTPMPAAGAEADKDAPASIMDAVAPAFPQARITAAYQAASPAVRDAFNGAATAELVRRVRTGHKMPPEVAQALGAQVGYVLLGLLSETEFQNQLLMSGTAADVAQNVVHAFGEQLFQKVLPGTAKAASPAPTMAVTSTPAPMPQPAAPTVPVSPAPVILPTSVAPKAPTSFSPIAAIVTAPSTVPVPPPLPLAPQEPPAHPPAPDIPGMPQPEPAANAAHKIPVHGLARTMAQDMEHLMHPDHEQVLVPPSQRMPARSFQTSSVPKTDAGAATAIPSTPMPHPMPPVSSFGGASIPSASAIPSAKPMPTFPESTAVRLPQQPMSVPGPASGTPSPSASSPFGGMPLVKEYSVDPYREAPE